MNHVLDVLGTSEAASDLKEDEESTYDIDEYDLPPTVAPTPEQLALES